MIDRNISKRDWRVIAEEAAKETEPSRLNRLFQELNEALENQSGPVAQVKPGPGVSLTYTNDSQFASSNWHDLYIAALFEDDRKKIPSLVNQAEAVLLVRERELFSYESNLSAKEKEEVSNALHALRALRGCLGIRYEKSTAA